MEKIKWCMKLNNGIEIIEPNDNLCDTYIKKAENALKAALALKGNKEWEISSSYYAMYFALYAVMMKIGVKCENHTCSILTVTLLLGDEKTRTINLHKDKRIDAQYYMKLDQELKVRTMLREAKIFVSNFDEIISRLTESEIKGYRGTISKNK